MRWVQGRIVIEQMIAAGDPLLAAAPQYTQHTASTTLNFRSVAAESKGSDLSPLTWRCGPREWSASVAMVADARLAV